MCRNCKRAKRCCAQCRKVSVICELGDVGQAVRVVGVGERIGETGEKLKGALHSAEKYPLPVPWSKLARLCTWWGVRVGVGERAGKRGCGETGEGLKGAVHSAEKYSLPVNWGKLARLCA